YGSLKGCVRGPYEAGDKLVYPQGRDSRTTDPFAANRLPWSGIGNLKGDAMSSAERFASLRDQVDHAEQVVKAATSQSETELEAKVEEARRDADKRAAELSSKAQGTAEDVQGNWNQFKSDWDQHVRRLHERVDAQKSSIDTIVAAREAQSAEADALDAI